MESSIPCYNLEACEKINQYNTIIYMIIWISHVIKWTATTQEDTGLQLPLLILPTSLVGFSCANWFYHYWQDETVSALQTADVVQTRINRSTLSSCGLIMCICNVKHMHLHDKTLRNRPPVVGASILTIQCRKDCVERWNLSITETQLLHVKQSLDAEAEVPTAKGFYLPNNYKPKNH